MQNNKQPKKKKKKRVPEEWVLFLIDALYKVGATLNRARSALGLFFASRSIADGDTPRVCTVSKALITFWNPAKIPVCNTTSNPAA